MAERSPLGGSSDPGAVITVRDKGAPLDGRTVPLDEVGAQGWNLLREDLPLPLACLKTSALEGNSRWMREFVRRHGVALAPHGKTTMAPALFALQQQDGAWGITLSTPHQVATAVDLGFRRIFIANQIVGKAGIRFLFDLIERYPDLELYTLVDSVELVDQIERAVAGWTLPRRLNVLVEKGFEGGRTGCRTVEGAMAVARRIAASPILRLAGVEGFEGIIRKSEPAETLAALREFLVSVVAVAESCAAEGLFDGQVLLSAGGSAYFDLVVHTFRAASLVGEVTILLRSGCYITHDSGMYTRFFQLLKERAPEAFAQGGLTPALEVWVYVQSLPEPGRAILSLGKRDIGHDEMPLPQQWFRPGGDRALPIPLEGDYRVTGLNDQHAYLTLPAGSPLRVGDMISLGISHPCLTFDKWRVLHLVDDGYDVVGAIRTYF